MADQPPSIPYPFPPAPSLYEPAPQSLELLHHRPVAPVRFPDGKQAWLVTRYADVRQVLVDPRFSRAAASSPDVPQNGAVMLATGSILGMDPPEHTRLRRLVARAFTARRVEELRPRVTKMVGELLDTMETQPRPIDLVRCFSLPLPVRVICELLGVPAADQDLFHGWSDTLMGDWSSDPARIHVAQRAMGGYFVGLIAAKRREPADDLMTALIAARDAQDRLSEEELVTMCFGLLLAGHETTANQINMMLLTLLRNPAEWDRLQANPHAMPQAVEELMRFVQLGDGVSLPRVTTEEVQLGGVSIPAGATVLPAVGVAGRDPALVNDPERLDLSRIEVHHLSFGAGPHHCLGAHLARVELQEALRGLARRVPGIRLAVPESALRFKPGMLVRSLEALPVTW
jgi:cytochrome P450